MKSNLESWESRLTDAVAMLESAKSVELNEETIKHIPSLLVLAGGIVDTVRGEISKTLIQLETACDDDNRML